MKSPFKQLMYILMFMFNVYVLMYTLINVSFIYVYTIEDFNQSRVRDGPQLTLWMEKKNNAFFVSLPKCLGNTGWRTECHAQNVISLQYKLFNFPLRFFTFCDRYHYLFGRWQHVFTMSTLLAYNLVQVNPHVFDHSTTQFLSICGKNYDDSSQFTIFSGYIK